MIPTNVQRMYQWISDQNEQGHDVRWSQDVETGVLTVHVPPGVYTHTSLNWLSPMIRIEGSCSGSASTATP